MNDQDLNKIRTIVKEEVRDVVKTEVRDAIKSDVRVIVKEEVTQIVKSEIDFAVQGRITQVIRKEINLAIDPVKEELANLMVEVKGVIVPKLDSVIKKLNIMDTSVNKNRDNIGKLNRRLKFVEGNLAIQPPAEHQIIE